MSTVLAPAFVELANFLIPAGIFALLALALNVQWGYTGLFNAGVAGFWAIGAYTTAILITPPAPASSTYPGHLGGFSQNFFVAALVAMLLCGIVGYMVTLPILRLRADYFAIATLAVSEIVRLVLTSAENLTAGSVGIILIPRPFDGLLQSTPGTPVDSGFSDLSIAALVVVLMIVAYVILEYLYRSSWGRVLRGIREDDVATLAAGKHVSSFQMQAFVLGCVLMGLAGAVFTSYTRFIVPDQFEPLSTFTIYVMVILGGSGNNRGVIFGAFLFYSFDWVSVRLKDAIPSGYSVIVDKIPYLRLMVIGFILVLLILYRPEGILKERKQTRPPVTGP